LALALLSGIKPGDNNSLIFAFMYGDIEGVKMIIGKGTNVDSEDSTNHRVGEQVSREIKAEKPE
jgi:hypothetical protein